MVQLARDLLQSGHRLAFGGTLGIEGQGLTQTLLDISQRWLDETAAGKVDVNNRKRDQWSTILLGLPTKMSPAIIAHRLVGICEFIDIKVPGGEKIVLDAAKRHRAEALTEMRERMTRESRLRVVWGGRVSGAEGWIPGILEEVVMSLKH